MKRSASGSQGRGFVSCRRVQVHTINEAIKIHTRNGPDWTDYPKKVATDAWLQKTKSAIIDGEVVVPAADGTTDFSVLQKAMKSSKPSDQIVIYAFDLLYLNGLTCEKRR